MSFSTMKEPCKEGCRPYSPLKFVNQTKFGARGTAYLCKITIAARSPFGRPPARRVGIAFPCAAAVVCAAVGCTVPPWGLPSSRAGVERAPAQAASFPLGGGCPLFSVSDGGRAPGWKEHQRRPPIPPDGA